jgi:predicted enzyme related to lactoylglutathione lyase
VSVHFHEVVIDCADPRSLARWWASVTGYDLYSDEDDWASVHGEGDRKIIIGFQKVPESKVVKNRVHVDLGAADIESEAQRMESLGAKRLWVSEDPEDPFIVLADPEGNEFCVVAAGTNQAN